MIWHNSYCSNWDVIKVIGRSIKFLHFKSIQSLTLLILNDLKLRIHAIEKLFQCRQINGYRFATNGILTFNP